MPMKPQNRADIVGRLADIARELEHLTMSPAIDPDPEAVSKILAEQEELEFALASRSRDSLG